MSRSDDTPTWRKNKPRIQTSDERALQHRQQQASSPGIPMPADDRVDTTNPWDVLDREDLTDDEMEVVRRSRRESSDPATVADVVKVLTRTMRKALDERSEQKKQLDEAAELLDRPPRGVVSKLEKRVDSLSFKMSVGQALGGVVLAAALGSLGLAYSALRSQAVREGELNADITRLKSDVQLLLRGGLPSRHQTKDNEP